MVPESTRHQVREHSFVETWIKKNYPSTPSLANFRVDAKKIFATHTREPGIWNGFEANYLKDFKCVGVFLPRSSWDEPLSLPTFNAEVVYPALKNGRLSFRRCKKSDLQLSPRWGVLEAPDSFPEIIPDLVLTPCFLADLSGNRVGRGGGFYDRYFSEHSQPIRVGLLHSDFLMNSLPTEWLHAGDQKLHALITEKEFIKIKEFI